MVNDYLEMAYQFIGSSLLFISIILYECRDLCGWYANGVLLFGALIVAVRVGIRNRN